ncbi:MAG: RNA polymerase sigma factor [Clostridia bacterium]|nr:RNA polymerase sigma factor [Clostridia bacterium]
MNIFSGAACAAALRKIAAGDMSGLELIYEKMGRQIYTFALGILGSEAEAEDVMQETFLRIMDHAGTWRGGQARAWIMAITRNLALERLRGRRAFEGSVRDDGYFPPDRIEKDDIERALDSVSRDDRQIVLLRAVHRFKYSEISKITGYSEEAARKRYVRAIEKMRKTLKGENDNERTKENKG